MGADVSPISPRDQRGPRRFGQLRGAAPRGPSFFYGERDGKIALAGTQVIQGSTCHPRSHTQVAN